jgi:hypothetical protein
MGPHLRYLRYVLMHKLYVFMAGVALWRVSSKVYVRPRLRFLAWVWRLLVHDLSKFRPSEWRPYVASFYGTPAIVVAEREWERAYARAHSHLGGVGEGHRAAMEQEAKRRTAEITAERRRAFDLAWLLHQHRNDHHWQHWLLREDSGATKVLLPPAWIADEMLADWLGAGTKINRWPTLAECVGETIVWYAANREKIMLREQARARIEETLHMLASHYGLVDLAHEAHALKMARSSIVIPGR